MTRSSKQATSLEAIDADQEWSEDRSPRGRVLDFLSRAACAMTVVEYPAALPIDDPLFLS